MPTVGMEQIACVPSGNGAQHCVPPTVHGLKPVRVHAGGMVVGKLHAPLMHTSPVGQSPDGLIGLHGLEGDPTHRPLEHVCVAEQMLLQNPQLLRSYVGSVQRNPREI